MLNHKRIVIVGASASGKNVLRSKFEDRGFTFGVSYTTREIRPGETQDKHYHFISRETFEEFISMNKFYESTEYNGNYYGSGIYEWHNSNCFIMETSGIKNIKSMDRKNCFIIYLNPSQIVRETRMLMRGWDVKKIKERIDIDKEKFVNFTDYDLVISNSNF